MRLIGFCEYGQRETAADPYSHIRTCNPYLRAAQYTMEVPPPPPLIPDFIARS